MPYTDKAKQKAYNRQWYLANQKHVRERLAKWRKDHAEQYSKSTKAWREANREKIRAQHRAWNKAHTLDAINRLHDERMRRPFPITMV